MLFDNEQTIEKKISGLLNQRIKLVQELIEEVKSLMIPRSV